MRRFSGQLIWIIGCGPPSVDRHRGDPHRGHLVLSQRGEVSGAFSWDDRIVHGRGHATGECQPPLLVGLLLIGIVPAGTGHADVVAAAGIEETGSAHTEAAGPGQREAGGADCIEAYHLRAATGDLHPPTMDVEEGMAGEEGELSAIGHPICPTTIRTRIVAPFGQRVQPHPEFPFPARPVVQAACARKPGMADAEGVETGGEALALRTDHRLQQVAILRPFEAAGTGAEPQVEAAEVLGQSVRGIRQPFAAVESGAPNRLSDRAPSRIAMMSKAGTVDRGSRGEENAAADPYLSGCQAAYFIAPYPPIDSPATSWPAGAQSTEKFALRNAGISSV